MLTFSMNAAWVVVAPMVLWCAAITTTELRRHQTPPPHCCMYTLPTIAYLVISKLINKFRKFVDYVSYDKAESLLTRKTTAYCVNVLTV